MSASIRIIDTGPMPARWNVAMTAAVAGLHAKGRSPDSIRLHRYPACVLLGRSQDAERAADLDYCRRHGIELARRVTGGGAVYMSPHMLAWDVVVGRRDFGGGLDAVTRRICEGVAAGLSQLGAVACFRAPNDIEIGGRKVSGSSGYADGHSAVLQGTVVAGDDAMVMARALRIPEASLREKMTSLGEALGRIPPTALIASCLVRSIADALAREALAGRASADETALCEALLAREIGTEEFVSGSPAGVAA
jgi:lipoate-protein ligase A